MFNKEEIRLVSLCCTQGGSEKVQKYAESQCPRTDLSKRFLPKPMTTTGRKGTP